MCQNLEKEENDNVIESSWVVLLFYIEVVPESSHPEYQLF